MAENPQFMFSHKEIVETLIKQKELHEGLWALSIQFGFSALTAGPDDDHMSPTAFLPVLSIGIQKTDKLTSLSVDAAFANPAPKAKKTASPKKKKE